MTTTEKSEKAPNPKSVQISMRPESGQEFLEGSPVRVSASASPFDPTDPIRFTRIENSNREVLAYSESSSAGAEVTLQGTYRINASAQTVGDPWPQYGSGKTVFNINGGAEAPVGISISEPANDSAHGVNAPFNLVSPVSFPSGKTVAKVEYYVGEFNIRTRTTAPYNFQVGINTPGIHLIKAKIFMEDGQEESDEISVYVADKQTGLAITSPADGTVFTAPGSVLLKASLIVGTDTESVNFVRFFHGGTKLEDVYEPGADGHTYEYRWEGLAPGGYLDVRAVAVLKDGGRHDSQHITIFVH